MWCLISQPNSLVIEINVNPKGIGQECLEKVCKNLGILNESDYFGLKYENNKGEELWLNLRNPIDRQVNVHGAANPLRLALRVKFWVPPHLLLQERTRHIFYQHAHLDLIENRLLPTDWDCVARLTALIAQAEYGDYDESSHHNIYQEASSIVPASKQSPEPLDLMQRIVLEHKKLKSTKQSTAEYWLLKEISELENFGEELFTAKSQGGIVVGIGPQGVTVYCKDTPKQQISYTSILSASSHRRTFKLEYLSGDTNKETVLEVKLDSNHAASSLYRALTEKHAFYSCETVRSAVTSQFIRDWKGTIVSIINEDSSLGKKYVFDIRRTCREVYDNARRALYQNNELENVKPDKDACNHDGMSCKDSEEKLQRLLDAVTCKICMDNQINVVFLPCAHVVACMECAERVDRCPLCRSEFQQAQRLYFQSEFLQIS